MHKSRHFRALERFHKKETEKSLRRKIFFRIEGSSPNTWKYFWWEIKNYFYNLCTVTSLHGFRQITTNRLSLRENQVWAAICFLAVSLLIFFLAVNWDNSINVKTSIEIDSMENIKELNFPAVTVCNHNQVYKPFADKLSGKLTSAGFTNHQIKLFFQSLPILIRPFHFREVDLETFHTMFQHLNIPVKKLMRQLMQPCEKMIPYCSWVSKEYNCSALFQVVESYMGHCCAFNYHVKPFIIKRSANKTCENINPDDKDIQCKKDTDCPGRKTILKVPGSGIDAALYFYINLEPSQYLGMTKRYSGASLMFHESHNYPQVSIYEQSIQFGKTKSLVLSGTETISEEAIKQLPINLRKCVFKSEMNSRNDFSFISCIARCTLKRYKEICGCIPFYYRVTCNNTRACDFSDIKCIKTNIDLIRKLHKEFILENGYVLKKCNCQRMCNKIQYTISVERAVMTYGLRKPYISDDAKRSRYNISVARVYFQDYTFLQNMRRLTFSWQQTIGSLGGLFGLCLGGSFISILEPIVHLLMGHIRKTYDQKVQAKEDRNKNEDKNKVNDNRKKLSSVSKIHKRLPLRERLKNCDNLPPQNDISMLQSDFKMYLNLKKSQLILPRENNTVSQSVD